MHACNGCSLGKWILDVSFCRITNMCSPNAIATFSKAGYKWVAKNCIVFSLRLGVPLSCVHVTFSLSFFAYVYTVHRDVLSVLEDSTPSSLSGPWVCLFSRHASACLV